MTDLFYGIDCSTSVTVESAKILHNLGYTVVMRYLVPDTYYKHLSENEARILTDNSFKIGVVYETTGQTPKRGISAGEHDAEEALKCAKALNMPNTACIYFAVDYEPITTNDFYNISNYFIGVKSVLGDTYKMGVYGNFAVVEWLARQNICNCYWQCVAWSYGNLSASATMYQHTWNKSKAGILVDENIIYKDVGFWNYNSVENSPVKNITAVVNGKRVPLKSIIFADENYIRIRDLADVDNTDVLTVDWDSNAGEIIIITKEIKPDEKSAN